MKTDIPLKRLTALRGEDLLPLLGLPAAALVKVESRALPASETFLDTILRVRSPQGQEYLHIVEWQGYRDEAVLWRLMGYCAWFGRHEPKTPVVGTVVYLRQEYDTGNRITPTIDGQVVQPWVAGRVALWEQDAPAALASGKLGLAVLSPLMQYADVPLVEQAVRLVMEAAPPPQQGELLATLGVFATPLMETRRFIDLVGREQLMSTDLFEYLMQEQKAEWEAQKAELRQTLHSEHEREKERLRLEYAVKLQQEQERWQQEQERWQQEQERWQQEQERWQQEQERLRVQEQERLREAFQQTLEDLVLVRFPDAPLALHRDIQRIQQPAALRRVIVAVQQVPDLAAAVALLREAAEQAGGDSR